MNSSASSLAASLRGVGGCWGRQGKAAAHEYAQRVVFVEAKHEAQSHSRVTQPSHRESIN